MEHSQRYSSLVQNQSPVNTSTASNEHPVTSHAYSRASSQHRQEPSGSLSQPFPSTSTSLPRNHDPEFSSRTGRSHNISESLDLVPSQDRNEWYYPMARSDPQSEDYDDLSAIGRFNRGNWGNKMQPGARWKRRGKSSNWGAGHAEWEMEERARKRLKHLLPAADNSTPPSPRLSQRRSPTPPSVAPYAPPIAIHSSYSSFVLDPSVQHSFHSSTISELERTSTELIEGESTLRRALGSLFRAMDVEADEDQRRFASQGKPNTSNGIPMQNGAAKPEPNGDIEDAEVSARALMLPVHRRFITPHPVPLPPIYESNMLINQETQIETFEKSLAFLRELMDDGIEFIERLEEIREGLGTELAIRKGVWKGVRLRALQEMDGSVE